MCLHRSHTHLDRWGREQISRGESNALSYTLFSQKLLPGVYLINIFLQRGFKLFQKNSPHIKFTSPIINISASQVALLFVSNDEFVKLLATWEQRYQNHVIIF